MDLRELPTAGAPPSRHPWELARLRTVTRLVEPLGVWDGARLVLDVGCGDAFVAASFARAHPQTRVVAIDTALRPDEAARRKAELGLHNIELFDTLDAAAGSLRRPVAAIFLLDVLEHIEDPVSFLRGLHQVPGVSEQTQLILTVPAGPSLFTQHDVFLGHFRRYTRASLRAHLDAGGFRATDLGAFFTSLVPVRGVEVVAEKLRPRAASTTGVQTWSGPPALSRVLAGALTLDARVGVALSRAGVPIPGLSLYAVARPG